MRRFHYCGIPQCDGDALTCVACRDQQEITMLNIKAIETRCHQLQMEARHLANLITGQIEVVSGMAMGARITFEAMKVHMQALEAELKEIEQ